MINGYWLMINKTKIEQDLRQITDMLLLNGTLTDCPGLVKGKLGIAIFFFHHTKFTGNDLFADYAIDLLGETLNQIHLNSPADYEKGLAGIGVGIDYMIRNDFLKVEDDICEDFDGRMVRAILYDPCPNFSQYSGLTGYGRYWMTRLRYEGPAVQARKCLLYIIEQIAERLPDIPFVEQTDVYCFLQDICQIQGFEICKNLLAQFDLQTATDFSRLGDSAVGNIVRFVQQSRYFNCARQDEINATLAQLPDFDMEKPPASTGLLTGYAGEGMLRLTALHQANTSWMQLV